MGDRTDEFIAELEPNFGRRIWDFIYHLRVERGVPAYIREGRRSYARQLALYAQGRTTPGRIVTQTLNSKHRLGRAVDIAFWGYRDEQVPLEVWKALGAIGEAYGLKWGGRFKTLKDYVHFEI